REIPRPKPGLGMTHQSVQGTPLRAACAPTDAKVLRVYSGQRFRSPLYGRNQCDSAPPYSASAEIDPGLYQEIQRLQACPFRGFRKRGLGHCAGETNQSVDTKEES